MIFLDMDGVLCDFVGGLVRVMGREDLLADYPAGQWLMGRHFGVSDAEMIARVDALGLEFWSELERLPWAHELVDEMRARSDVEVLSDPNFGEWADTGKRIWLRKHYGRDFARQATLTSMKQLLANGSSILIDDSERNVKRFVDHGGEAILFPQPWNHLGVFYPTPESKLEHVRRGLESIRERKSWLVGSVRRS